MKIRRIGISAATLALAGAVAIGGLGAIGASAQTPEATPQGQERPVRPEGAKPGRGMARGVMGIHSAAAEALGIEKDALRTELQSGKTLAQVGEEHGFSRDELKEAITEAVEQKLAQAVTDGTIMAEKQQEILDGLSERIDNALDSTHPGKMGRGGAHADGTRPEGAPRGPRGGEQQTQP